MESEILSSDNVKPSRPTPKHLQTYNLSFLDQISSPALLDYVLYFQNTTQLNDVESFATQTTHELKRSLSLVLTLFYPLSGRVNGDGQSINCSDQGLPFVAVRFRGHNLSDLMRKSGLVSSPRCLIPYNNQVKVITFSDPPNIVAFIQLNFFDCGGVAVGLIFWHKVLDGMSMRSFINAWSAAARGAAAAGCPNYISQFLFLGQANPPGRPGPLSAVTGGRPSTRRYVFDETSISKLKSAVAAGGGGGRPTRVEVVSALLWKCFTTASLRHGRGGGSVLAHVVDLRRRARPAFAPDCFGNFVGFAAARPDGGLISVGSLVRKIRESVAELNSDFVGRMQGDEGLSGYRHNMERMWGRVAEDADVLKITSWCGFGLYESVDFGWGKPVWLANCDRADEWTTFSNVAWLMDTRDGGGIEAWVNVGESYMPVFNDDEELRALAWVNPCPLDIPRTH